MDFIQTANKQVDKFGVGKHGFSAGNPGGGVLATLLSNLWCDGVQQELINVIEAAGLAPSSATLNQLATAIQSGKLFSASAAGTADALTASFTPAVAALKDGMALFVRAGSVNATATPTFTPNNGTIAAKTIVKGAGGALAAGDIAGAGHWIELQYDLTLDKWVLLNPGNGIAAGLQPGEVAYFATSTLPTGYLKANGALVSRTTYAALFAKISTTYGVGDGSTTFQLPDTRGEFIRGWDDARGVDSGRALGSAQSHAVQDHTHASAAAASGAQILAGGSNGAAISGSTTGGMITGTAAAETRPRNIAFMACIKY